MQTRQELFSLIGPWTNCAAASRAAPICKLCSIGKKNVASAQPLSSGLMRNAPKHFAAKRSS